MDKKTFFGIFMLLLLVFAVATTLEVLSHNEETFSVLPSVSADVVDRCDPSLLNRPHDCPPV